MNIILLSVQLRTVKIWNEIYCVLYGAKGDRQRVKRCYERSPVTKRDTQRQRRKAGKFTVLSERRKTIAKVEERPKVDCSFQNSREL